MIKWYFYWTPYFLAEDVELLALTRGKFDAVPIEKMKEAEAALLKSLPDLPQDLRKRLISDKSLKDEDKDLLLKHSEKVLAAFQKESSKKETDGNA